MFPYSNSVTPAVQSHLESQTAFMNEVSKSYFESFQSMTKLNLQLVQTMMEESNQVIQLVLCAEHPSSVFDATANRAQPVSEKLRAYQQHMSRLAAESQISITRITEEHVPKTSSTAKKLAEDVARTATEETQRRMEQQQETMRSYIDPFAQHGHEKGAARAGESLQGASGGNVQGSNPEPTAPVKSK